MSVLRFGLTVLCGLNAWETRACKALPVKTVLVLLGVLAVFQLRSSQSKGVRALKREISGVEWRIDEPENRLRAIDAAVDEVIEGVSSLQARLLILGNGINGLGEQTKAIETEVSSLRASVNYMGTQVSTINSEISSMRQTLSLLQYP